MKSICIGLIALHGLVHFLGFAKAFGLADLPELTLPVSRFLGTVWLAAGISMLTTSVLLATSSQFWWFVGCGSLILSQLAIAMSWSDAKFGTIANVLILGAAAYAFASEGPPSFRQDYLNQVRRRIATAPVPSGEAGLVTESDLERLPEPVRRYVRVSGAVGQPRIHHVKATWRGRIRTTAMDEWMEFRAEQYNFPGEPSRFFLMEAKRGGFPVDVYHAFVDHTARMRVRLVSLVPMVDAAGPEMNQAETVTLFNDLALLAPGALIDPAIRWEPIDAQSAQGYYTAGSNTVGARMEFNDSGELVNFVSDDRFAASADGSTFSRMRWSTPVEEYRQFGPYAAATRGEGRWHPPDGAFAYIDIELTGLEINGPSP